ALPHAPMDAPPVAIRDALVGGIARRRRRARARVAVVGAVALLGAVTFGAASELSEGPPSAFALVIEERGSWTEVRIKDADATAEQMTRELRDAGIGAEVHVLPTGRQHVGEWMGFQRVGTKASGAGRSRAAEWSRGDIGARGTTLLIGDSALGRLDRSRVVFYVGRERREGERPYLLFADGPRPTRAGR
ncbi:MAG TPA: hypothetical protein VHF58_10160, partial [Solirubrobacterales bacterium]|nr:hypothetical protein [Solirubrobacterales bacterium]